ncbi:MAG: hypothetical protein NWE95_13755 [Candidatus Bathyarchaeota archaeon]|nr:hypothetical protein [Candidatus Bathyarchaeota archaeon]
MLLVIIILALIGSVCVSTTHVYAAKETGTPTPTTDTGIRPTDIPPIPSPTPKKDDSTPTPWVVILITATPDKKPPTWQIPDLDKKIKYKSNGAVGFQNLSDTSLFMSPVPKEIDDRITVFMDWLIQRQREYYGFSGKYAQMLITHYLLPADGIHQYPDGWFNHPTDQQYAWPDLNAIQFEPMPVAIHIDVYNGPEGIGFVSCFSLLLSGFPYQRCVNYGPEALRNRPWSPLEEAIQ